MARLTVIEIKKQIAALEAKAARLAEQETKASVDRVRALMKQLGVTLEHLSSTVVRKGAAIKRAIAGAKPATAKRAGKGVAKYQDPKTGATWSGFGRAPGWIVGAANRDAYLVSKDKDRASGTGAKAPAVKKASPKTATAKKAAKTSVKRTVTATKKAASKAATPSAPKRNPSIKASASKAAAKKAARKTRLSGGAAGAPTAAETSGTSAT